MLDKLHNFGVRRSAYMILQHYLRNRARSITQKSVSKLIKHGVPQASILDPVLFTIHTRLN